MVATVGDGGGVVTSDVATTDGDEPRGAVVCGGGVGEGCCAMFAASSLSRGGRNCEGRRVLAAGVCAVVAPSSFSGNDRLELSTTTATLGAGAVAAVVVVVVVVVVGCVVATGVVTSATTGGVAVVTGFVVGVS